ncbi:MAG: Asp-tRNA(Asn)/Glu-tRNA(Gln) amidotransferase subunit GatB [Puniceicoccales bacterium]|jgi:aspartyl-tRNA(Asn)/glutamyl-tRNA(Gln) amidotransferase subunit B|nr:Asp-tRNA(Asn)/Glu-tRNA(Gln) amidotransferase subunit GatB [Puniceicoccales bacterium]
MEYEAVIGLEVHVQIRTKSKLFSRCPYRFGEVPNALTDQVTLGLPGTLPVINREAVLKTIRAGLIFGCDIAHVAKWDRKNYFYPDCPKNYQISQNSDPICRNGHVEIELQGPSRNVMGEHRKIALDRIHLEEDVGKLMHFENDSGLDFNRAGVPLMEIVSRPDMHSSDEAFAYLSSLRMHMICAEISNCDMERGEMRCDANVSVRPVGEKNLGTKVEIKNLNSISGVKNGIEFEIKRQVELLKSGGKISQETRRWDAAAGVTIALRSKETAFDYRYFTDPDLMPIKISQEMKDAIGAEIPELPFAKQERFFAQYTLPYTITSVICQKPALGDFFERTVAIHNNPRAVANIIANDMLREMSLSAGDGNISEERPQERLDFRVSAEHLAELVKLTDSGVISKQIAQSIFTEMFQTGKSAAEIVEEKGLRQSDDADELLEICKRAIDGNSRAANEFRDGKGAALNALKGFVMRETHGKANTSTVDKILRELLTNVT